MTALRPILRTPTRAGIPTITPSTICTNHRPSLLLLLPHTHSHQQTRSANVIRRPKRPALLMQMVILSDGSAYTQLSTSPRGIVRSTKDVRNHPMWNPTLHRLMDVEEDEAGRLRAFRERFGRGWDNKEMADKERADKEKEREREREREMLMPGGVGGAEVTEVKVEDDAKMAAGGEEMMEEVEEGGLVGLISEGYEMSIANRGLKKKKRITPEAAPEAKPEEKPKSKKKK